VFHDNVLRHSAVIPFGGYVVTKDIKDACGLSEQVAEEVKLQFGVALSDAAEENKVIVIPAKIPGREPKEISIRNLAHVIQARMEEIIDGIMFEIHNSGCAEKLGYGIVLTGGGAMLRHLAELFQFRTGVNVRMGLPGGHLTGESENINEPCYATGVGLLMKGFAFMDEHAEGITPTQHENRKKTDIPEPKPVVQHEEEDSPKEEVPVTPVNRMAKKKKIFSLDGFKDMIVKYIDAEPDSNM
jgi:cell division protein FtsA